MRHQLLPIHFFIRINLPGEVKFVGTNLNYQRVIGSSSEWDWNIIGIFVDGVTLVQIEKNTIKAIVELSQLTSPGKKPGLVAEFLHTAIEKNNMMVVMIKRILHYPFMEKRRVF